MQSTSTRVVGPTDGKAGFLGSIGVRFMLDGDRSEAWLLPCRAPHVGARARGAAAPAHT